ncbi:c-type cytochrome [Derxia lacustris]|uniref:c-type cytochrome n=1 Tax=Derxia lacustris TaxID=764842 RepID=UPI001C391E00|nr:c-type cytochrome [Derxia lacustris]
MAELPADWPSALAARDAQIAAHLAQHRSDFEAFADHPDSQTDGVPFLILKLLPALAPELWGQGADFLAPIGLFHDTRQDAGYPAPRGIGFSGLSRATPGAGLDYSSFTCGACHIGRVRIADGSIRYLDGGINTQFNVILYREKVAQTLARIYGDATDASARNARATAAILAALDSAHRANPNFFYNDYSRGNRHFDAAYEQAQIERFRAEAPQIVAAFIKLSEREYAGWQMLVRRLYQGAEAEAAHGFAGTEDAIGFNAAHAWFGLKDSMLTAPFAGLALPSHAAVTDIMAVWRQDIRNPRWNAERSDLVDGGGQWNGHIPLPIYKNLAAQLTLGLEDVDVGVSAAAERLLDTLPAPAWPFAVDLTLARRGRQLFADNCAACHQPNNGRVYQNIGSDLGRARVANLFITLGAQRGFTAACGPETEVQLADGPARPCADYKGESLKGKSAFAMTWPWRHDGYNALPLAGIWAQAPYLHNGAVPTLWHLLMPKERPQSFVRGRLDYDTERVGFDWDPAKPSPDDGGEGRLFTLDGTPALSKAGHDRDIVDGDRRLRLDWSGDPDGARALIEYLKTL